MGKEMSREDRLDAEARAAVKKLLIEIEQASELPPIEALHPYEFNDRRKRVMRTVWNLIKLMRDQPEQADITTVFECPNCGKHIEVKEQIAV